MTAPTAAQAAELAKLAEATPDRAETANALRWAAAVLADVEAAPESAEAVLVRIGHEASCEHGPQMCTCWEDAFCEALTADRAATVARCFAERERLQRLMDDFEARAVGAEESCKPGCCPTAISEARWQVRAQVWKGAAQMLRAALETK